MILSNASKVVDVLQSCFTSIGMYGAEGIQVAFLMRHGNKVQSSNPKAALSEVGLAQVSAYSAAIAELIPTVWEQLVFASSTPERNLQSLTGVFGVECDAIFIPSSIDLIDLGPNGEDYTSAQQLAKERSDLFKNANEACAHLEEHGITRLGETTEAATKRVRTGIVALLSEACQDGDVLVLSINSPTGNEAVGVDGVLKELEVLVVAYNPLTDTFTLLDRVAPEFAEDPAPISAA